MAVSIFFIAAKIPQISHLVIPYAPAESIETGIYAVEDLGNKRAVILKHHGVTVVDRDLNEAMHSAIYPEGAPETYLAVKAVL